MEILVMLAGVVLVVVMWIIGPEWQVTKLLPQKFRQERAYLEYRKSLEGAFRYKDEQMLQLAQKYAECRKTSSEEKDETFKRLFGEQGVEIKEYLVDRVIDRRLK